MIDSKLQKADLGRMKGLIVRGMVSRLDFLGTVGGKELQWLRD